MTDPSSNDPAPTNEPGWANLPIDDGPTLGAAHTQPGRSERSRVAVYLALFVVATLSGAALFVSGFTLGFQQVSTPGTTATNQQLFEPFWESWNKVTSDYVGPVDREKLVEGAIKGVFDALGDPFSAYMTSDDYAASLSGVSGQFEGIGAEMAARDATGTSCTPVSDTCRLTIVHVLRRSPALTAGIQDGDILVSVDTVSVIGLTVDEVVARVRGPRDSPVVLGLERDGAVLSLTIVRAVIESEDVTSAVLAGGQIGYLKIDGFSSSVADDFKTELGKLVTDQHLTRIILDLRGDPGGFVTQAVAVASQFVDSGPIYWEEDSGGTQIEHDAEAGGVATDPSIRLVLLVDANSASASEIVAGALDDTGRATLVGAKTYGKGTIQEWHLLNNGEAGGFRLSVAKWLTPNKTWIHGVGITPDVVVAIADGTPADQDPQLDRAIELLTTGTGAG
ncbi:MAG: S41 family peptidase [Candidatus Limnocylindrales bacterium]